MSKLTLIKKIYRCFQSTNQNNLKKSRFMEKKHFKNNENK